MGGFLFRPIDLIGIFYNIVEKWGKHTWPIIIFVDIHRSSLIGYPVFPNLIKVS